MRECDASGKMASNCGDVINVEKWLDESKGSFNPPVCNKLMYGAGQLKVMYVGGPNIRKDYHMEEGEEFFYMVKGDMCLKIMERGQPKDVVIKEGEIFVLPSRIPHSPQRLANTIGLVIERERTQDETDGLRYYCEDGVSILYEKWFHCKDLVKDLPPIINAYMASEQFKTGKPIPGTITDSPPVKIDTETEVHKPFNLKQWLADNENEIKSNQMKKMFEHGEFKINVYGEGRFEHHFEGEAWAWQLKGDASLEVGDESRNLTQGDVTLIPAKSSCEFFREKDSLGMVVIMDPLAAKH